jgi:hypothetical protein
VEPAELQGKNKAIQEIVEQPEVEWETHCVWNLYAARRYLSSPG